MSFDKCTWALCVKTWYKPIGSESSERISCEKRVWARIPRPWHKPLLAVGGNTIYCDKRAKAGSMNCPIRRGGGDKLR